MNSKLSASWSSVMPMRASSRLSLGSMLSIIESRAEDEWLAVVGVLETTETAGAMGAAVGGGGVECLSRPNNPPRKE